MPEPLLLTTLDALCQHWQRQSLLPAPGPVPDVVALAQQRGLALPADFLALYRRANGMTLPYPQAFDRQGFYFLPVEELCPTMKDLLVYAGPGRGVRRVGTPLTVFVNYLQTSWEYGFIPAAGETGYAIGVLPMRGVFNVITTSLATFLRLYLEDAPVLYDHTPAVS